MGYTRRAVQTVIVNDALSQRRTFKTPEQVTIESVITGERPCKKDKSRKTYYTYAPRPRPIRTGEPVKPYLPKDPGRRERLIEANRIINEERNGRKVTTRYGTGVGK